MAHVLAERRQGMYEATIRRPYAGVKVEVTGRRPIRLEVHEGIHLIKGNDGVVMVRLPDSAIVESEGERVNPCGEFFLTAETIDPFHLLIDVLPGNRPF